MKLIELTSGRIAYRMRGSVTNPCLVIETALAASCAEWWHLADEWSKKYCVIVYDRAGYGLSEISKQPRTPENIANELFELLNMLEIKKSTLIGHSLGGLFAYQFSKIYPNNVAALILLDPVSPSNWVFKKELSKSEYNKSGVDKSINLRIGKILCKLGLGRLFIPLLKKAPPFYYYKEFSKETEKYILDHLISRKTYETALQEYSYIDDEQTMTNLKINHGSFSKPITLICHTPEIMMNEIEYYGNTHKETSNKIELLWVKIMKEYLDLSKKSKFMNANNSGHFIHLSDPNTVWDAIEKCH